MGRRWHGNFDWNGKGQRMLIANNGVTPKREGRIRALLPPGDSVQQVMAEIRFEAALRRQYEVNLRFHRPLPHTPADPSSHPVRFSERAIAQINDLIRAGIAPPLAVANLRTEKNLVPALG
jgi:hypothetical protein